jgi:hypothetical protein
LKIAIGFKYYEGPYGGGSRFNISLTQYLRSKGINVVHDLNHNDIDVILLTDPRAHSSLVSFGYLDIIKYLIKKKDTLVVQRVNECDERKNTKTVNRQLFIGNQVCDCTVFIGSWLIQCFNKNKYNFSRPHIILNGADNSIFKNYDNKIKDSKIRMVTHHWSPNLMKGWDIYEYLDKILSSKEFENIEFHYIGNKPENFVPRNIFFHNSLNNIELAKEISKYDFYITASINEPAGMHHIEGALCGLPILYRNSGALPEYCKNYGIGFNDINDFKKSLTKMIKEYRNINMYDYLKTSDYMNKNYFEFFNSIVNEKSKILSERKFNFNYINYFLFWLKYIKYKFFSLVNYI